MLFNFEVCEVKQLIKLDKGTVSLNGEEIGEFVDAKVDLCDPGYIIQVAVNEKETHPT